MKEPSNMKWYILQVPSGFEEKAKTAILKALDKNHLSDHVQDILLPQVNYGGPKSDKKKTVAYMKGYLFLLMTMGSWVQTVIQEAMPRMKFLGGMRPGANSDPVPVDYSEIQGLLQQQESVLKEDRGLVLEVGQAVCITEGLFEGVVGLVSEADNERKRLKVLVQAFGRHTPVQLLFSQVKLAESGSGN